MKRELKSSKFKKIIDGIRTTRKRVLLGNLPRTKKIERLRKLLRLLKRTRFEWKLDGYSVDLVNRFMEVLEEDIKYET